MFDSICKFLAENFSEDLASWLLGSTGALTELSPQELSLEPLRADSLILLQSDDLVLHTEFQTEPDAKIPFRMLDYRVRVYRRFPNKVMRQVVIYLGRTNSLLVQENSFRLENTFHQFEVIRLWEQPPEQFLNVTGLLPFAVLSQTDDPTMILSQVAEVIEGITDQQVQSNLVAASAILAGLVLNKDTVERILRSNLMRNSVIYQEILQEGRLQGRLEAKLEGKLEAKKEIALNLLRMGFSLEQVVQATGLRVEEIPSL